jgi:DNA-binding transcriptional LysR family regulator
MARLPPERIWGLDAGVTPDLQVAICDCFPRATIRDNIDGLLSRTSQAVVPILLERLIASFCQAYPDVEVEIVASADLVDIAAEGFDAGITRPSKSSFQDLLSPTTCPQCLARPSKDWALRRCPSRSLPAR